MGGGPSAHRYSINDTAIKHSDTEVIILFFFFFFINNLLIISFRFLCLYLLSHQLKIKKK